MSKKAQDKSGQEGIAEDKRGWQRTGWGGRGQNGEAEDSRAWMN